LCGNVIYFLHPTENYSHYVTRKKVLHSLEDLFLLKGLGGSNLVSELLRFYFLYLWKEREEGYKEGFGLSTPKKEVYLHFYLCRLCVSQGLNDSSPPKKRSTNISPMFLPFHQKQDMKQEVEDDKNG